MSALKEKDIPNSFVFISAEEHFAELLKEACVEKNVRLLPRSEAYLIQLLHHYIDSKNLFSPFQQTEVHEKIPDTFAEIYLHALNSSEPKNKEIMRVLAERSLYLSGFFGDSLNQRMVDLDYYMNIGSAAYLNLAGWTKESNTAEIYYLLAKRFEDHAGLLSYISEKSALQATANILDLYERYLKTGSKLAQDKLTELGVTSLPKEPLKVKKN